MSENMSKTKLTPSMRRYLENIAAGRSPLSGIFGMSAHGGASSTRLALVRRGFIDVKTGAITDVGRAAIATKEPSK